MKRHRLRVQELARARGIMTITAFSHEMNMSMSTARSWWYGSINQFDGDVMERVAARLGTTIPGLFEPLGSTEDDDGEDSPRKT